MKIKIPIHQVLCFFLFCFFMIRMPAYSLNHSREKKPAEDQDHWLLLLYDDGDFENGFDALFNFANEAYTHENLDILVLQDNFQSPAMIWQIGANHERIPIKFLGEINMADSISLEYFIKYADGQFPGSRVILCLYDHGAGCWGACIDETNSKENPYSYGILTPEMMRQALENSRSVDLICFTAPCNMGSIETAYELRHQTEAYIGSANTSGYCFWFGTIGFICDTLKKNPNIDIYELAKDIVRSTETYGQINYPEYYISSYTMSAVRSDMLDNAVSAIQELCTAILANPNENFPLFDQSLGDIRFYSSSLADIIDLFEEAKKRCQDTLMCNSFQKAIDAVQQVIITAAHAPELTGSNGLNVYFPPPPDVSFYRDYGIYGISFADDAGWFNFLAGYWSSWPNVSESHTDFFLPRTNGFYPPVCNSKKPGSFYRQNPPLKTRGDK